MLPIQPLLHLSKSKDEGGRRKDESVVTMLSLFLLAGLRSLLNLFGDSHQNLGQFLGLCAERLEALKISDSPNNSVMKIEGTDKLCGLRQFLDRDL